jgi:hypothetical protein
MGIFSHHNDKIIELLQKGLNDSKIGQEILKDNYTDSFRKHINRLRNNIGVINACEKVGVNPEDVPMIWLKNKEASVRVTNPLFEKLSDEEKNIKDIDFLNIFKDKIKPITLKTNDNFKALALFDRLVYTDVHIGMNVNPDGYSIYGGIWNEDELNKRLKVMVKHTLNNKKSNTLIIHELGDFLDGWDGYTTRGGHSLPQNMDNQKAFDTALTFKIQLIDSLINHYDKIKCINICNDNHAGSFGYIVNSAFKTYIDLKYSERIEIINQRRFIDHYTHENVTFILTHGKDDKNLKFGFKPILDAKQIEKIKNYIDEHKLHSQKIEFSKGDSHQYIFDNSTSKHFSYQNFPSFSPPSNWVQTNFQNSMSGFVHFNYYKNGQKSINDFIF